MDPSTPKTTQQHHVRFSDAHQPPTTSALTATPKAPLKSILKSTRHAIRIVQDPTEADNILRESVMTLEERSRWEEHRHLAADIATRDPDRDLELTSLLKEVGVKRRVYDGDDDYESEDTEHDKRKDADDTKKEPEPESRMKRSKKSFANLRESELG